VDKEADEEEKRNKDLLKKKRKKSTNIEEMFASIQFEKDLQVTHCEQKGRSVVVKRLFEKNEWVVEYNGELISAKEAEKREQEYKLDPSIGSYMFFFESQGKKFCIDATKETDKKGRLINHSMKTPNLKPQKVILKGIPKLIFVANRDIQIGEELLYDYGDRLKTSIQNFPWLKN